MNITTAPGLNAMRDMMEKAFQKSLGASVALERLNVEATTAAAMSWIRTMELLEDAGEVEPGSWWIDPMVTDNGIPQLDCFVRLRNPVEMIHLDLDVTLPPED